MDRNMQRDTKQMHLIRKAVRNRCDHPTADDIYMDVHEEDARISKGTVYRNLNKLAENGEILRVLVPGPDHYDSRLNMHYHFICTKCGKVCDVPIDYIAGNDILAAEKTDFKITRHRTVFEGLCADCLAETEQIYC